jgi:hypothetical protein
MGEPSLPLRDAVSLKGLVCSVVGSIIVRSALEQLDEVGCAMPRGLGAVIARVL